MPDERQVTRPTPTLPVRRVWRLGQVRPVRAVFSVYNGTMEARALSLMGAKMKAAQLLYGDEVGGAIVPEEDGDLVRRMAAWLIVRYVP